MYEGVIELKIINKHKIEVENRGYYYIGTYEKGDYTLDKNKLIKANCLYQNGCEIENLGYGHKDGKPYVKFKCNNLFNQQMLAWEVRNNERNKK